MSDDHRANDAGILIIPAALRGELADRGDLYVWCDDGIAIHCDSTGLWTSARPDFHKEDS
jgi:hypothetical protein